jgi:hypothetical protein
MYAFILLGAAVLCRFLARYIASREYSGIIQVSEDPNIDIGKEEPV